MLWHCDDCGTAYNWQAEVCPACGSGRCHPQGGPVLVDRGGTPLCRICRKDVEMAKGTVHSGPSNIKDPDGRVSAASAVSDAERHTPDPDPELEKVEVEVDESGGDAAGEVSRPAGNAATADWVDYVTALGGNPEEGATRSELIDYADALEVGDA